MEEEIMKQEGLKDWKLVISSGGLLCQQSTKTIFLTSKDDFGGFLHELAHAKVGIREEWDKTGHDAIWGDELTNLIRKYTTPKEINPPRDNINK
jgi:hypothetical protein